jgi:hypothetical protein
MNGSHADHDRRGRRCYTFARGALVLLGALVFLCLFSGCAWRATPPPHPKHPATVFLADYGHHSRIAVQLNESELIEYSFGDWRYYAQSERSWWRGFVALGFPGEAGLGRRTLPLFESEREFIAYTGSDRSHRLEVEQERTDQLLRELDERWEQNRDTAFFSEERGLHFVKDDERYHLFNNSNHKTAEWLERLGFEISGAPIISNYRVEEPRPPAP